MSHTYSWRPTSPPDQYGYIHSGMWEVLSGGDEMVSTVVVSRSRVPWLEGVRDTHAPDTSWHIDACELIDALSRYHDIEVEWSP